MVGRRFAGSLGAGRGAFVRTLPSSKAPSSGLSATVSPAGEKGLVIVGNSQLQKLHRGPV